MSLQSYIQQMKKYNENLLNYLDNNDDSDDPTSYFGELKTNKDQYELKLFLKMMLKVYNNHHLNSKSYNKVKLILKYFQNEIQQNYSNTELFLIFKRNKKVLLFLIKEKMITIDDYIFRLFTSYDSYIDDKYPHYFLPEIKPFMIETWKLNPRYFATKHLIEELKEEIPENFEENREIGENESLICTLIRNDSVEEFITYINKTNYPLDSHIEPSIYETNIFLNKNQERPKIKLINYAAFFGSIQIIQYLISNGVELDPSLWLYSIHSNKPELFHLLEENHVSFTSTVRIQCFKESIKCHHNEIANYIKDNYLSNMNYSANLLEQSLKNYNFYFIENDSIGLFCFYELCRYDYFYFVKFLLKKIDMYINSKKISK